MSTSAGGFKLVTIRFGEEFVFRYSTIQAAASEALKDLERSWATPLSIKTEKGDVIWRMVGNANSDFERLQKFSNCFRSTV